MDLKAVGIRSYFNFQFTSAEIKATKTYNVGTESILKMKILNFKQLPKLEIHHVVHEDQPKVSLIQHQGSGVLLIQKSQSPTLKKYLKIIQPPLIKWKMVPSTAQKKASYSRRPESGRLTPGLPEVQEALQLFYEAGSFDVVEKSWASNKHKICHPLIEKQRQYLLEKYNGGIVYPQKFNVEVVDEEMRRNRSLVRSDFLTPQQITLFWAREARFRRKEPTTFYSSNLKEEYGVEDEEEPYKDPVMSDPHLEYESELLKTDCFE